MHFQIIHRRTNYVLQVILFLGALAAIWEQQWLTAVITVGIIAITLFPILLEKRFSIVVPIEFEFLAVAFVFASLFLGEVRGYYVRYWWWDIALHTASGFLLGIVGFLLVHILNEIERINIHMKPGFVAFFAFLFAVGMGALWEIFEFSMDQLFGMNMQKPMFNDPSGLTDTMWDLIVDTVGSFVIAMLGYGYLKSAGNTSFLERWIRAFIQNDPRLFKNT